jgi:DNA-binding response OmpR family regulator
MSSKHILLIADDLLISSLYREELDEAGFEVSVARTGEAALQFLAEHCPDAIVIDPITPNTEAVDVIRIVRMDEKMRDLPILTLPTARMQLADSALHAGATTAIVRSVNPIAALRHELEKALDLEERSALGKSLAFHPDERWVRGGLAAGPEALNAMRRTLHGISRDTADEAGLRTLFQQIHNFTEQMALIGERPIFIFGAAIEALAHDHVRLPSQVNPSTLRTFGQAIDLLGVLLDDKHRAQARDPGTAQILVVDDEDGARKIIMAAMQLVGLKSVSADLPSAALAAANTLPFDLIFLDVGLPEMNGFDLCDKIRTLPLHEKTPIVFLTGMATFQNRVKSSLSGGNDFIGKPFNLPELGVKALMWVFKAQLGKL